MSDTDPPRGYVIISPVRDEASSLEVVAESLLRQSCPPTAWVIVDDGSTDDTLSVAHELARRIPFLRVVSSRTSDPRSGIDARLSAAAEAVAFNEVVADLDLAMFSHIGKLDGDIELPSAWYATLLERFAKEPRLGIAGGALSELTSAGWLTVPAPVDHVHGAVKLYSTECFVAIGGIEETLGWDSIDQIRARMSGFVTSSSTGLVAKHLRPTASRGGVLRGQARMGRAAWVAGYPWLWIVTRGLIAPTLPSRAAGVALVFGYVRAAVHRVKRVDDPDMRAFLRRELRLRVRMKARQHLSSLTPFCYGR